MNRYNISHPLINSENYTLSDHIKAVHISLNQEPTVVQESSDKIVQHIFSTEDNLLLFPLNKYIDCLVYSPFIGDQLMINTFATYLYRIHNNRSSISLYGPCLLFGSYPLPYSSVPYELLEQISRILKIVHS